LDYIASTIRKFLGVNNIDRMSPRIYPRTTMTAQKAYNVGASHIDIAYERFGDPAAPPVLLIMGGGAQMINWPEGFGAELATADCT
jgi:hypothetical protein